MAIISFVFLLVLLIKSNAFAQQTIFNVPSADVTEKGKFFIQQEGQFSDDFGLFTTYSAFGIGKNTEIDVTLFGVGTRNVRNQVFGIGFKKFIYLHEKSETKLTFGSLLPVSLEGHGVGGYAYSHLSTRLPRINTRLTAGVFVGTTTVFGKDFVSFIAGVEQPITKRFGFIMDWYSGKNSTGFLIPGFSYKFNRDITFFGGYQIPNNRINGDDGFVIELSKIF